MTYAQFKAFHAVAQERNFHRAAGRLGLTQPAISIQVRNLERDNAQVLFRRRGHKVELTEAGRVLFDWTSQMFEAEAGARRVLSPSGGEARRTLHLGADGPQVALDLIAAFKKWAPGVQIRVSLGNAEATWDNLLALKVDAAVMANAKPDRQVTALTIARQSLVALMPATHELATHNFATHKLAGEARVTLEQLCAHPLIFREPGSNTQRIVDEALAARRIQVSPYLVLGSREAVKEAVARGLGIGFVFDREVGRDPACRGIGIATLEDSNSDMLLSLKDQRANPLVATLFAAAGDLPG